MVGSIEEADVLVVGGGTAGFGAAIAAGRKGLRTVLLEATTKVGGVMAFCPGMPWGGGYPVDTIIGGVLEELIKVVGNLLYSRFFSPAVITPEAYGILDDAKADTCRMYFLSHNI